ncbi:hypothetical protein Scep_010697 [Stephania cephalantha]|uniref:non-specific serine/threonine protein kinase n=1 Tax=Stephania cephalantha TaxID=152367 RepID=A0AAP0JVV9_9MAGN
MSGLGRIKILSVSLCIAISIIISASPTLCDDASVMKNLAKSLQNTPPSWSSPDPCQWKSVWCDASNSVTRIDLSSKSVSGTLPPDLNLLAQMQTLALQNNRISGPLPSFANMGSLQNLYLDSNNFTSVPAKAFDGLTSLQTLSLSSNPNLGTWAFPQELTQSASLVTLYASNVNLIGSIPDVFDKWPSLQDLRLSYNNLTGVLPGTFAGSGIRNLWLNNQDLGLSGEIDVIGKMPQLKQVWLHKNSFWGPIPDFQNSPTLFDLQLRDNQLTGVVPESLSSLPALQNISLANNKLQGPVPGFGAGVNVDLGTTNKFCSDKPGPCSPQVTTLLEIAGALGYPSNLAESWSGNDPCKEWSFITCDTDGKSVTVVNFANRRFLGTISPAFANLTSLRSLLLNDNNLTGPIPDSLTRLSQLQVLDVSNNNLSGKVPDFRPGVNVKRLGNPLLGTAPGSGGGGTAGGDADSSANSTLPSGNSRGSVSGGVIAGAVIAVLVFVVVVSIVSYKLYKKKHNGKFGRISGNPQNEKPMTSNGMGGGGNGTNEYGAVNIDIHSQSSDANSDAHFADGGNVAISIQVLRQVTNNFSEENILGRGGFGVVYKGVLHDGTRIAVKRMESTSMGTKGLNEFQAEIAVLTKVRHRHLVALLGYCINGHERLLVYEYMPQGTLAQHLFEYRELGITPLTWKQRVSIALDVARGVEYLHSLAQQSFIHRDLKPSNILLGDDMRAKVADFGLVKNAPDGKYSVETRLAGTFGYLAPEYAATGRVTTKVDVYAFGVVLMEMITGRKALDENMPEEKSHLVTWFRRILISQDKIRSAIDSTLDPDDDTYISICKVAELAGHCTAREPSQRPDMGHAVNVLGPLVEQWKPSNNEYDDGLSIDMHMSLPQVLERWQAGEGSSMTVDYSHCDNIDSTQSSIPGRPAGMADSFQSRDGR